MASSELDEKDEMGSLFEGMVLFNPSQMEAAEDESADTTISDLPLPTIDDASAASASSSALSSLVSLSQPLDESLFTDLMLITPPLQSQSDSSISLPSAAPTTTISPSTSFANTTNGEVLLSSSVSRQVPTRKKKRAGLRIGYGRDDQSQSVESELSPPPSLPLPSDSAAAETISGGSATQAEAVKKFTSDLQLDSTAATATATTSIAVGNDFSDNTYRSTTSSVTEPAAFSGENIREKDEKHVSINGDGAIERRFERIKAEISEKLRHVREVAATVSAARKDSIRRRRKAAENVNLASTKYKELEKELEEACEAEDFETADRVSESLASAEKEKELLAIALRDAEADRDTADSKMQEALQLQIAAEEECATLLNSFAMDAANSADTIVKNAEVISSKEMDIWLSSTEALEVKKMEVEIESDLINEARLTLSTSAEHLVEDDRRARELLCKKKCILTEELEKLLALVKEKEAEIAENNSKIDEVEKRIADVASGFQEAQASIDKKYNNLQSGLSQMELENETLFRKKKEINDFFCLEEDWGKKIKELARNSADEAHAYQEVVGYRKSLVQFILKSRAKNVRLVQTEEKLSEDVQTLKQEVSALRASLQELSSTKSSIQQEISSFKQGLLFIDKRIPELEAEKKVAAAARNFKEAARIATEAKTLSVEKEDVQVKMERAMLELGKLDAEICCTLDRLQETEVQISLKEKELAIARFQRLLITAGAATAERSAALELGDHEEADILQAEAEAADSEARKLQPVYDFKDEDFVNLQKYFISMDLVSNLGGKQLAELAASARISAL